MTAKEFVRIYFNDYAYEVATYEKLKELSDLIHRFAVTEQGRINKEDTLTVKAMTNEEFKNSVSWWNFRPVEVKDDIIPVSISERNWQIIQMRIEGELSVPDKDWLDNTGYYRALKKVLTWMRDLDKEEADANL